MTTLAWDASCLFYAAQADRLDVLADYASGPADSPWRNVTTQTVVDELSKYGLAVGGLPWLEVVDFDALDELNALMVWIGRHGAGQHNRGEATVCAWASIHDAIAVIDDRDARRVARTYGVAVHGSLWVLAKGVEHGRASLASTANFVDRLRAEGARYAVQQGGFGTWCERNGLLQDNLKVG